MLCSTVICRAGAPTGKSFAGCTSSSAGNQQICSGSGPCRSVPHLMPVTPGLDWLAGEAAQQPFARSAHRPGSSGCVPQGGLAGFQDCPGRRGLLSAGHIWGGCQDVLCRHKAFIQGWQGMGCLLAVSGGAICSTRPQCGHAGEAMMPPALRANAAGRMT